ncbi:MAG: hypothetical protein WA432_02700 [Candidatus Babeliaceae bacterium]
MRIIFLISFFIILTVHGTRKRDKSWSLPFITMQQCLYCKNFYEPISCHFPRCKNKHKMSLEYILNKQKETSKFKNNIKDLAIQSH